jgi:hypothetical protein
VQPQAPAAAISPATLPTLAPLQDLQFGSDDNNNSFQNFQVPGNGFSSAPAPIFRTSGS